MISSSGKNRSDPETMQSGLYSCYEILDFTRVVVSRQWRWWNKIDTWIVFRLRQAFLALGFVI